MNEIQLSDSLPVIETEIRQYQNLAGESIFEIGRRLKHVKENDLAHGEFGKWLESIGINQRMAQQMIKVASNPELKTSTYSHLGAKALYEIATLPEPERTKEHITSKGETKTPDGMTVKELRELKKKLKERDELLSKREQENDLLQSKLDDAENREPEVIEKYTEPEDYEETKNLNNHLVKENEYYKGMTKNFKKELKNMSDKNVVSEVKPTDQTPIVLEMIRQIGLVLSNEDYEVNAREVNRALKNILVKVEN